MKSLRTVLGLVGAAMLAVGLSVPTAAYAEDTHVDAAEAWVDRQTGELLLEDTADPSEIEYGVAPRVMTPLASGPVQTSGKCRYHHNVDNPHVTGGEASVHGWWTKADGSGECPATATVKARLQAWGCYNGTVCGWRTVVTGPGRSIKPGTAKRANARNVCASTAAVTWRGQSDVDLDWQIDPSGWFTGDQQLLNCYPSS